MRTHGAEKLGVNSTPTFFINGKMHPRRDDDRGTRQADPAAAEELTLLVRVTVACGRIQRSARIHRYLCAVASESQGLGGNRHFVLPRRGALSILRPPDGDRSARDSRVRRAGAADGAGSETAPHSGASTRKKNSSMKLTRLRLIGFKSFVEPTDFLIEPGLTGVVGPNGCGKSNLVEALRWVMGENSYKSMRATDMDQVIFSGSGNRPARNNAEVSMAIDNAERTAPAGLQRIRQLEVARRIEREQGSTYRINGREVRARDVQILFADASTGARSPALVHQGRIGEIIQAKPEQRRRVLEEAAGISGLHARRHEAELRLRAAEQNLQRLEDVIGQLASQMDALKRQARQAVRYRTVSAQVRKQEATLFHLRWLNAQHRTRRIRSARGIVGAARGRGRDAGADRSRQERRRPPPQPCRRCAKPKRARARRCSGWSLRARRSTARRRAPRSASPNSSSGWCSSTTTSRASGSWRPIPRPALERLTSEAAALRRDLRSRREQARRGRRARRRGRRGACRRRKRISAKPPARSPI